MNTDRNGMPPALDPRDWEAQEAALATPRHRADALLAHALRTMPVGEPPAGFAAEVARLAAARRPAVAVEDAGFERRLLQGLLAVFALSAAAVVALFGGQWWAQAAGAFGSGTLQWGLAGAICLGLSWLLSDGRRVFEAAAHPA